MTPGTMRLRYLGPAIREDMEKKMVFLGGPRQVGKTTLANMISADFSRPVYLNWDNRSHRRAVLDGRWSPDADLLVFDELHKYRRWKSHIKGIWDTRRPTWRVIVTGSSRLDVFRRGGDSLQGRYHYYRLHPFSLREMTGPARPALAFPRRPPVLRFDEASEHVDKLLRFGGFPEPLLAASDRTLKRWQKQRFERVFREDIREVEHVLSLSQVELLGMLLPDRVGAPLSMSSLASDIEVSPKTVSGWIELLCRNYYAFRVPPYYRRLQRALKKECKYYLWDWSEVREAGPRFENMVGAHLLKFCHYYEDTFGVSLHLFYLRDLEKREVDFLLTWEGEPWCMVECKLQPGGRLTHPDYFARRLGVEHRFLVTQAGGVDYVDRRTGIRSISAERFLMALI
ncbi:MAG: ATP-binding protein [Kiritimatiellae bacterium]|nr:ATP-binding protein [Kiritimatiellia bacterium]